jgi:hypothetical protein
MDLYHEHYDDMCSVITVCGITRRGGIKNEDIRRQLKAAKIVE